MQSFTDARPLRVALVAGEASGDQLGVALMNALRARMPAVQFRGVTGPKMRAAGCETLAESEALAVMGLFEVLTHLPRLWQLRRRLVAEIAGWHPDVFVGVDAPSFNLGLSAQLKQRGMPTVQYVSPQVWAWRQSRVHHMATQCDRVLCLLPFEPAFYECSQLQAEFVGHPMADDIALPVDRADARAQLNLAHDARVLAVLPGSRRGEVQRLAPRFVAAVRLLLRQYPQLVCLVPLAGAAARSEFERALAASGGLPQLRLLDGQARIVLQAADAGLITSGTASLEALLCGTPMAVAYRFSLPTILVARWFKLYKQPFFAMPNLLAGEQLVPEFLQEAATPEALAAAVDARLQDAAGNERLRERFALIHRQLRVGGAARAAEAILNLLRPNA